MVRRERALPFESLTVRADKEKIRPSIATCVASWWRVKAVDWADASFVVAQPTVRVRATADGPTAGPQRPRNARKGGTAIERGKCIDWDRKETVSGQEVETTHAFQACSIDHSDISPFRINELRAAWNSVAQNLPSRIFDLRCPVVPIVCCKTGGGANGNCARPSYVV